MIAWLLRRFRRKLILVDEQAWRDLLAAVALADAEEIVGAESERWHNLDLEGS
jgi:hypothetical protein